LQAILQAIEADERQAALDVDNALVAERNRDMRAMKRDLETLKDATMDVAGLVVDQGDELAVGQRRTERAKMAVEVGTRELKVARNYKSKSRIKCYLFAGCLACIVLLGAAAAFVLLYNDGEYWNDIRKAIG
jgi:t-SNARE complex subunit (syntaxin)